MVQRGLVEIKYWFKAQKPQVTLLNEEKIENLFINLN
jgi:hypothetical protein